MKLKKLFFLLSSGILFPGLIFSLDWEKVLNPKNWETLDITIVYYNYNTNVHINKNRIQIEKKEYEFQNPISPNPSNIIIKTQEFNISKEEILQLLQTIKENHFFDLQSYYGAPELERYYPFYIMVTIRDNQNQIEYKKEVLYRSNPVYPSAPIEFLNIKKQILHLIEKKLT